MDFTKLWQKFTGTYIDTDKLKKLSVDSIEDLLLFQFKYATTDEDDFKDELYKCLPLKLGQYIINLAIVKDMNDYPEYKEAENDCDDRARRVINSILVRVPGAAIANVKGHNTRTGQNHEFIFWIDEFSKIHTEMIDDIKYYKILRTTWE